MLTLNNREMATLLAALRMFQKEDRDYREAMPHFEDMDPLSDDEIDDLCERIATEED